MNPRRCRRAPSLPARAFHQGLLSNLGNPKMAVFFAGIFPQFAPHGQATFSGLMMLGVLFSTLTLLWLTLYAAAIDRAAVCSAARGAARDGGRLGRRADRDRLATRAREGLTADRNANRGWTD